MLLRSIGGLQRGSLDVGAPPHVVSGVGSPVHG